jgi:hypothetical protein
MASDGLMRQRGSAPESELEPLRDDIQLEPGDRDELLHVIGSIYHSEVDATPVLRSIGFPVSSIPAWAGGVTAVTFWDQIFSNLEAGAVAEGYRRLIQHAMRYYPANRGLRELHQRYIQDQAPRPQADGAPAGCRVFVRTETEQERTAALETLRGLNLDPREELSTELVTSYSVSSNDVGMVRRLLGDTGWTVASADGAHYLLRTLIVQGPDGSRFRLTDTPAAETFGTIAAEVVGTQYPGSDPQSVRPTVVNHIREDGQQERANPDQTLDEAGVQDGDQMSVAFEGRAGSVNPGDWEDALARVRRQITGYARDHGIRVTANSATLPTRYSLAFTQPSLGPPPSPGEEPTRIESHLVRIEFPQGFPVTAPQAWWVTPFFHPNVFPTYDCELTIGNATAPRGLVCLGQLADSWFPAQDLAEVCRFIIDIAAYRNYDLFGLDAADLSAAPHINFYDPEAAFWVLSHQDEIARMGGAPVVPVPRESTRARRTTIERLD